MNPLSHFVDFLLPVAMIIFGVLFAINPPSDINEHYGFRTKRSMKSKEAWRFANTQLGKIWVILGIISIIFIGIIKSTLNLTDDLISMIGLFGTLFSIFISLGIVEKELKLNFDKKNKLK